MSDELVANKVTYKIIKTIDFKDLEYDHFLEYNETLSFYEIIRMDDGECVGIVDPRTISVRNSIIEYEINGKQFYLSQSLSPDNHIEMPRRFAFSWGMAEMICGRIATGETMTAISKDPLMPSMYYLQIWRKQKPDFNEMIEVAYQARGESLRDKIVEELDDLDENETSREMEISKTKIENYKWLASKDNSNRFGNKTEVKNTGNNATVIVLETGVRKDGGLEDYSQPKDVTPAKTMPNTTKQESLDDRSGIASNQDNGHHSESNQAEADSNDTGHRIIRDEALAGSPGKELDSDKGDGERD